MLWLLEHVNQLSFSELTEYLPLLRTERRERVLSMRDTRSRVQSVMAELLLRRALEREYGLLFLPAIAKGEKGKPYFAERLDIHFNFSHCSNAVACALDAAPVGVDVQEFCKLRRPDSPADSTDLLTADVRGCRGRPRLSAPSVYRILSEVERAWVRAGETAEEQDRRFTAVWTCKEAYGKATGNGILYAMKDTEFLPGAKPWRQYGFTFQQFFRADTVLTLCASGSLPLKTVKIRDIL